jgi:glycyl-tRNA synthetase (class II)
LREPAVGEFGTEPAFVSNCKKHIPTKARRRDTVVALRAEFVVKAGHEETVRETIDAILENSFGIDREFLQALVLVSELESRLVTVLTFWKSRGFAEARERRVNWLRQRLAPYLDQTLRVQSYNARVTEARPETKTEEMVSVAESYPTRSEALVAAN